ncbi:MAG TPA: hypothetical protein VHF25_16965 [Nitriliruptorales bacterium]|nr:hypothetical protein [Nitriliruptorales bacterium]
MSTAAQGRQESALAASFRDPSGFVYERDGTLYRQVDRSFAEQYDLLLSSGLYDRLVAEGLLVPHEEMGLGLAAVPDRAYRVLRPERIPFVSYPYEWCPGQLRDAAIATLRIQTLALDYGMSLRDASAYNIQFRRGHPVHIDTLSFERYREGEPWVAYRQFCRHFLAPLALQTRVDARLAGLLRADLDGVALDLTSELLPLRTRLRPGLLTHLHLQARAERRYAAASADGSVRQVPRKALLGLVDSLRGTVERLAWQGRHTAWSGYYAEADHYSDAAMAHKQEVVAAVLDTIRPASVVDLGANTGRFSRLAADRGAAVVALDADAGAVEQAWQDVRAGSDGEMLPLVVDLANPSPALGWAHEERASLAARGPFDVALVLALIHHLAIGSNVPLDRIAAFLARLCRHAVVEFVPKDDPRVRQLLASRQDVFADYSAACFERAADRHFTLEQREQLRDSTRILYVLRARRHR